MTEAFAVDDSAVVPGADTLPVSERGEGDSQPSVQVGDAHSSSPSSGLSTWLRQQLDRKGCAESSIAALDRHCLSHGIQMDSDTLCEFRESDLAQLCSELGFPAVKSVRFKVALRSIQRSFGLSRMLSETIEAPQRIVEDEDRDGLMHPMQVRYLFLSSTDEEFWLRCQECKSECENHLARAEREMCSVKDNSEECETVVSEFEGRSLESAAQFRDEIIDEFDRDWNTIEQAHIEREIQSLSNLKEYIIEKKREFARMMAETDDSRYSGSDRLKKLRRMQRNIQKLKHKTYSRLPVLDFVKVQGILDGEQMMSDSGSSKAESSDSENDLMIGSSLESDTVNDGVKSSTQRIIKDKSKMKPIGDDDRTAMSKSSSLEFLRVHFDSDKWSKHLDECLQISEHKEYLHLDFGLKFSQSDLKVTNDGRMVTHLSSIHSWILIDPLSVKSANDLGIYQRVFDHSKSNHPSPSHRGSPSPPAGDDVGSAIASSSMSATKEGSNPEELITGAHPGDLKGCSPTSEIMMMGLEIGRVYVWRARIKNPRLGWFFIGVSENRSTFKSHSCRDSGVFGLGPLSYFFAHECSYPKGLSTNALLSADVSIDIRLDSAHRTLVFAVVGLAHSSDTPSVFPFYNVPFPLDREDDLVYIPHFNLQGQNISVQCAQIPPSWFAQTIDKGSSIFT